VPHGSMRNTKTKIEKIQRGNINATLRSKRAGTDHHVYKKNSAAGAETHTLRGKTRHTSKDETSKGWEGGGSSAVSKCETRPKQEGTKEANGVLKSKNWKRESKKRELRVKTKKEVKETNRPRTRARKAL